MTEQKAIHLTIDNQSVSVPEGTTIWEAARSIGIDIPTLCHDPKLDPVAVCRVCAVEVDNARTFPSACIRTVEKDMVVKTNTEQVHRTRGTR